MSRAVTIAGIAVLLALVALVVLGVRSCARDPDVPIARVDAARNATLVGVAADGNAITSNAITAAAENAATTKGNEDAIRSAPGSDTRVPDTSNRVALERLCKRGSYRDQPRCASVQRPRPGSAGR